MAYDEGLAQQIREYLRDYPSVEEKKMMGTLFYGVTPYVLRNS